MKLLVNELVMSVPFSSKHVRAVSSDEKQTPATPPCGDGSLKIRVDLAVIVLALVQPAQGRPEDATIHTALRYRPPLP